jgi:pimeloyl-ACP methyl ester carboxylesterase
MGKVFSGIMLLAILTACNQTKTSTNIETGANLIVLQEQGSFAVGGTILHQDGQTFHGDHAYVFYQIPTDARRLPLVFLHGTMQFSKTWETTPDGREGFHNIFLRRGFATYLMDQPRRGDAGRSTVPASITPVADEQNWFNIFRLGVWPDYFEGVQFARDEETLNQYFRQITPNTGNYDLNVISDATAVLFDKIGGGVFVTHSQGGGIGWVTAIKSRNVRGIVSYEPGSGFVFPGDDVPAPIPSSAGALEAVGIPMDDFMQLTKIPIVIYYGDNIPAQPSDNSGADGWRIRLIMARLWAESVNKHGGDVTVVHLPETGIYGNTHFPFSDLNNVHIADLVSEWLHNKGLDIK